MAYADGALDPATAATVEAAIDKHPQYREKVEKFRSTRNPIRAAFQEELETTHLGPLIDRIRRDEFPAVATAANSNSARVVQISGDWARTQAYRFRQHLPLAMAASVALLIGATLGWSLHSRPVVTSQPSPGLVTFSEGGLLAQGALRELLEHARSGTPVMAKTEDGEAWRLKATFTFRSVSRSPCRRYEMSGEAAGRFAGYACRSGAGSVVGPRARQARSEGFEQQGLCAGCGRWRRCARGGHSRCHGRRCVSIQARKTRIARQSMDHCSLEPDRFRSHPECNAGLNEIAAYMSSERPR